MAGFESLSAEIHDMIFRYLLPHEKLTVTSMQMRKSPGEPTTSQPPRVIGRFTRGLSGPILRGRYRHFLEVYVVFGAENVKVNVVDHAFNNFGCFLADITNEKGTGRDPKRIKYYGHGKQALKRFHFTHGGTDPIDRRDLDGAYFALNLIYTTSFQDDQTMVQKWLNKVKTLEKGNGHLRVFYKVTRWDRSPALSRMIASSSLTQTESGQLKFLKEAIRKRFARPVGDNVAAVLQRIEDEDINRRRGRIEDDSANAEDAGVDGQDTAQQQQPPVAPAAPVQANNTVALGGLPLHQPSIQQPIGAPPGGLPSVPPAQQPPFGSFGSLQPFPPSAQQQTFASFGNLSIFAPAPGIQHPTFTSSHFAPPVFQPLAPAQPYNAVTMAQQYQNGYTGFAAHYAAIANTTEVEDEETQVKKEPGLDEQKTDLSD